MTERRFTDKEVALILRRAADLEKRPASTPGAGRGLTLSDLEEIAAEAGIDPSLVERAVGELEGARGMGAGFLLTGPRTVRRELRAVSGELTREDLAALIRLVDSEVADQGTVQEALGSVRWTSKSRTLSTQVSVEPGEGETLIRVEERFNQGVKGVLHGLPSSYGLVLGLAFALEGLNLGFLPGAGVALATAATGWGLGTAIWRALSSNSRARVQRLVERLGLRAEELSEKVPDEFSQGGGTALPGRRG